MKYLGFILTVVAMACSAAQAQAPYPIRPVRAVIPVPPGGGIDLVARVASGGLSAALGQPVIIDNRSGARNVVAAEIVAKAAPDGYTLLVMTEALTIMPFTERKLPFDARRSFVPISMLAIQPLAIAVHPAVPASSVKELAAMAQSKPGALLYGSGGFAQFLAGELIKKTARFDMTHVPYKGGGELAVDLMSGRIQAAVVGLAPMVPLARSGKIRVLAVTTKSRSVTLPGVPTLVEAGISGVDVVQRLFMLAPAGTHKDIIARLNSSLSTVLRNPSTIEKFSAAGYETAHSTPAELSLFLDSALNRWGELIQTLGIQPE